MGSPLFLVSLVEALNKLRELVWYAFIDDIGVHCPQLLAEFVLDVRAEAALLALCSVGVHGIVRRPPILSFISLLPRCPGPMSRDSRIHGWNNV